MSISTESYTSILQRYRDAIKWMKDIGVKLGPNRTSHYDKIASYWAQSYRSASPEEAKKIFPDLVSSMLEIQDFVDVYEAFKSAPHGDLRGIAQKLQKGVNGPINAADETSQSTTARNFIFEALMAARAHRPKSGVVAILDSKSDTGIKFHNNKIWIECKRVTTVEKIEQNARKGSSQLENLLKGQPGSLNRGVVAMDISKILNSGNKIFVQENDSQLLSSVDSIMDQFIRQYSMKWQQVYARRHKKVIGTIIRFSFMSTSEVRKILVHTSQWAVNPRLGLSDSDNALLKSLAATLKGTI